MDTISIVPERKSRQRRRQPRREYKVGEQVTITATYQGTRMVPATIEKISRKVSSVRNIEIVTYTLAINDGVRRATIMTEGEFCARVREN